ncbi:DinB family protein [Actinoplanes sp. NPDC026619]|uniref:DinB family protein n=1 Tax=Actinoplanes sp. NPDC026619 TaxID=3155798 RepID=UPI00340353D3
MVAPIGIPDSTLVSAALEHARAGLRQIPDDGWGRPADGLDWTCRETMAHILDDLGAYAMQLSGAHGHEGYAPLMEFSLSPGRPPCMFWPEEEGGTRAVLDCLDAVGGLLVAVIASVPADRTGWHPYGNPDRSALAAMGIVELALHTRDILGAHHLDHRAPAPIVEPCLERIFAHATRSDDPWHDLLAATGRTPESRGRAWRWDSTAAAAR